MKDGTCNNYSIILMLVPNIMSIFFNKYAECSGEEISGNLK
jgi:hypothetical protein